MKKNYFEKLVKYISYVYKIDEGLRSLTEERFIINIGTAKWHSNLELC
jgi:hypothetical protein